MSGLWNRKFDHKNGEDRVCKVCDVSFHTMKPINSCRKCTADKANAYAREHRPYERKGLYPFDTRSNEAGNRFYKIRIEMRKAWLGGREALDKHYAKQLKEAEDLGILKWINDRRDKESKEQKQEKSKKRINNDYPDTRGYYED
jgi:hypothetical protein